MKNSIWVFVGIYMVLVGGYAINGWIFPMSQQAKARVIKETKDSVTAIVLTETFQRGEVINYNIDTVTVARDLRDVVFK